MRSEIRRIHMRRRALALLSGAIAMQPLTARADAPRPTLALNGRSLQVELPAGGGLPLRWTACAGPCADDTVRSVWESRDGRPLLELTAPGDARLGRRLRGLRYHVRTPAAGAARNERTLELVSEPVPGLQPRVQLRLALRVTAVAHGLHVALGAEGPGAARFTRDHRIALALRARMRSATRAGAHTAPAVPGDERWIALEPGDTARPLLQETTLSGQGWSGARDSFWAVVARPAGGGTARPQSEWLLICAAASRMPSALLYIGPLERHALARTDPALGGLRFSGVWPGLRQACLGFSLALDRLLRAVPDAGAAIVLLALAVKLLLHPLNGFAQRWQHRTRELRSELGPAVRAIRAQHRGDERARHLLELHRTHGVHPLHELRAALGPAIQLPIFLTAAEALSGTFSLHARPFALLGIRDLAQPDGLLPVPWSAAHLNVLPIAMLALTLGASRLHGPAQSDSPRARGERRALYALAILFFALLYPFPAGMVLYWATGSALALARELLHRRSRQRATATAGARLA
jgi:membrane protein insertase Oxa1/YidC/SpoIIIJ